MKRQNRTEGAFVKIQLNETQHSYARVLKTPLFAFYDCNTNYEMNVDGITACPILFRLWVMDRAVTSGRWKKVGSAPLEPMPFGNVLALLHARAEELQSRANAKIDSIGPVSQGSETEKQREMRYSAQWDFGAAAEINGLITEIEQS